MLTELLVENLGPIAAAEIVLQPGSSALTGETGAGKTLLVTAVTLLTGGRADRGIIRDGAAEARVEGRFLVPAADPVVDQLQERGLLDYEGPPAHPEVVIARTIGASGSRARVNGRLVPLSVLAEIGPGLVEIAGQHEHHRMSSPRAQREILDAFIDMTEAASEVAASVRALTRVERELEDLRASERERVRELDVLRFEIDEIEAVALRAGETAELTTEATRLEHAEQLGTSLSRAVDDLGGDGGADERISSARGALEDIATVSPGLRDLIERLEAAAAEIRDVAGDLATRIQEPDPVALEEVRDRIGELARLRRKYGDEERDILDYVERSRTRAEELAGQSAAIEELDTRSQTLRTETLKKAQSLSEARGKAAPKLAAAVEELLAELAMPGAAFEVALEPTDLYEGGIDAVSFQIATGPGEKPRPLTKIASGGELSRISLALHLVPPARSKPGGHGASTMIFDEVDAGVGGAAARAVGSALAKLGRGAQVLVVTHLPQVAAFADAHYRVQRVDSERRGVAVEWVEANDRVEELSRMLAGLPESERAREHAQELLDLAAVGTE